MADVGIYTTNSSIVAKAGINASSVSSAVGETDKYVLQVEAKINILTRFNWSDVYSGLDDDLKQILLETTSNLCAIYVIINDMSGFTSRAEAQAMIDVLRDTAITNMSIIIDQKAKTAIKKT